MMPYGNRKLAVIQDSVKCVSLTTIVLRLVTETMQAPMGSVAMMQIDCEVLATRLVHVEKSALPVHLRENTTAHMGHRSTLYQNDRQWTAPVPHR